MTLKQQAIKILDRHFKNVTGTAKSRPVHPDYAIEAIIEALQSPIEVSCRIQSTTYPFKYMEVGESVSGGKYSVEQMQKNMALLSYYQRGEFAGRKYEQKKVRYADGSDYISIVRVR